LLRVKIGMETCRRCGANLVENAKYCYACGATVEKSTTTQEFSVSADDLTKKVRELVHEGNVSRIIVKDEKGKVLLEIPVTAGIVGVLLAPWLAAVGVIGALATKCTLVVERRSEVA
jgi:ribosomal protein L37E